MKNFTFAGKWHEVLKSYSEEIQKEVYRAAVEYAFTGIIVEMQPLARMAFDFIRYEIDEKARRREARLAKKEALQAKEQPSSTPKKKQTREKEDAEKEDAEKITTDSHPKHNSAQQSTVITDSSMPLIQPPVRKPQPIWPF